MIYFTSHIGVKACAGLTKLSCWASPEAPPEGDRDATTHNRTGKDIFGGPQWLAVFLVFLRQSLLSRASKHAEGREPRAGTRIEAQQDVPEPTAAQGTQRTQTLIPAPSRTPLSKAGRAETIGNRRVRKQRCCVMKAVSSLVSRQC